MADIKINVQVVEGQAKSALAGLDAAAKQADKSFDALNISVKGMSASTVAMGNIIANVATKAFEEFVGVIEHLIGGGLELEAQIEGLTAKFQALLPATQDAKKFLDEIAELSDKSPFEFKEFADAAKNLLVFGVNAEHVSDVMSNLGDIAAASGANLGELSLAFGKASEAGIITGRELTQFRNNGIPIVQALATELGVTTGKVKQLADSGKIDVGTFEKALQSLGKEGGFAFNAMANAANTLTGAQKKLNDSVESLEKIFGKALAPAVIVAKNVLAQIINTIAEFLTRTNLVEQSVQFLVSAFSLVVRTGAALYDTFNGILFVLNEAAAGITFLATQPIRLFLDGINSVLQALSATAGALGLSSAAFDNASAAITSLSDNLAEVPKTFHETASAIATDIVNTSDKADAFANSVENSYVTLAENMKQAAKGTSGAALEIEQGLTEAQIAEQQTRLANDIKFSESVLEEQQKLDEALLEQKLFADGEIDAQDELQLLKLQDQHARELQDAKLRDAQLLIDQDERLGQSNAKILEDQQKKQSLQAKFDADNAKTAVAIAKAEDKARTEKIKGVADYFGGLKALTASSNKELFAIGKAAAIAESTINTYLAITKTMASVPYPFNIPLAFAQGVAGFAQVQNIAKQSPGFADGGIVPGNSFTGDNVSARLNSGEMVLNKSQQSTLFDLANGGGQGGQIIQINNTVELDGEVVARSVSRQVANGFKLGEVV